MNTLWGSLIFEHVADITMHVVQRKYYFEDNLIILRQAFASKYLEYLQ